MAYSQLAQDSGEPAPKRTRRLLAAIVIVCLLVAISFPLEFMFIRLSEDVKRMNDLSARAIAEVKVGGTVADAVAVLDRLGLEHSGAISGEKPPSISPATGSAERFVIVAMIRHKVDVWFAPIRDVKVTVWADERQVVRRVESVEVVPGP